MVGVHAGFIDTEMVTELARGLPKDDPADVARQVFDAVEAGRVEVLADARPSAPEAEQAIAVGPPSLIDTEVPVMDPRP